MSSSSSRAATTSRHSPTRTTGGVQVVMTAAATVVVTAAAVTAARYIRNRRNQNGAVSYDGTNASIAAAITPFEEWMALHNHQPTFEEQLELAAKLYQMSLPQQQQQQPQMAVNVSATAAAAATTDTSSAALATTLHKAEGTDETSSSSSSPPPPNKGTTTTNTTVMDDVVSWQGISTSWFVQVFCRFPYLIQLRQFGCPMWFVRKIAIYELLRQKMNAKTTTTATNQSPVASSSSGPFIQHLAKSQQQPASRLLVYEETATLDSILTMVQHHHSILLAQSQAHAATEYLWMDFMCVDPTVYWSSHYGDNNGNEAPQPAVVQARQDKFQTQWIQELPNQIKTIHRMTLILPSSPPPSLIQYHSAAAAAGDKNNHFSWMKRILAAATTTSSSSHQYHPQLFGLFPQTLQDLSSVQWPLFCGAQQNVSLTFVSLPSIQATTSNTSSTTATATLGLEFMSCYYEALMDSLLLLVATSSNKNKFFSVLGGNALKNSPAHKNHNNNNANRSGTPGGDPTCSNSDLEVAIVEQMHQDIVVAVDPSNSSSSTTTDSSTTAAAASASSLSWAEVDAMVAAQIISKLLDGVVLDMNQVASTWHGQGKHGDAEQLYRLALKLLVRVQQHATTTAAAAAENTKNNENNNTSSPSTAQLVTTNNLASLLLLDYPPQDGSGATATTGGSTNWYEVEWLYRQIYEGFRQKLGEQHVETLHIMFQLATVLEKICDTTTNSTYGNNNHQDFDLMATGKNSSSWIPSLFSAGPSSRRRRNKQLPSSSLGVKTRRNSNGGSNSQYQKSHSHSASHTNTLLDEAESLYRQVFEGQRKQLGKHHIETLNTTFHLAELLRQQGRKLSEAQQLYRIAVSGYQQQGDDDNDDAKHEQENDGGRNNNSNGNSYRYTLAVAQHRLAQMHELMKCHEEVNRCKTQWGEHHTLTLLAMEKLAAILQDHGKVDDAERYYRQIYSDRCTHFGLGDFDTCRAMQQLANLLRFQCYQQHQQLQQQHQSMASTSVAASSSSTAVSKSTTYMNTVNLQKKINEAKRLYRQAIEGFQKLQQQQRSKQQQAPRLKSDDGEDEPQAPDESSIHMIHCLYNLADLIRQEPSIIALRQQSQMKLKTKASNTQEQQQQQQQPMAKQSKKVMSEARSLLERALQSCHDALLDPESSLTLLIQDELSSVLNPISATFGTSSVKAST